MSAIAFALALASQSPQAQAAVPWRLITAELLRVGVRPAVFVDNEAHGAIEFGIGVTVRVDVAVY